MAGVTSSLHPTAAATADIVAATVQPWRSAAIQGSQTQFKTHHGERLINELPHWQVSNALVQESGEVWLWPIGPPAVHWAPSSLESGVDRRLVSQNTALPQLERAKAIALFIRVHPAEESPSVVVVVQHPTPPFSKSSFLVLRKGVVDLLM